MAQQDLYSTYLLRHLSESSLISLDDKDNEHDNTPNESNKRKTRVRYGWEAMYNALLIYGQQHGHYNVPRRYICQLSDSMKGEAASVQLGSWLTTQRMEYSHGKLKPDRFHLLDKLRREGIFDWSPTNCLKESEQSWPYMFECLVDYCETKHNESSDYVFASIPEKKKWIHPVDKKEVGLGRWMHTQNKRRRENKLREDRLKKIQELVDTGKFRWPQMRSVKTLCKPTDSSSDILHNTVTTDLISHLDPDITDDIIRGKVSSDTALDNPATSFSITSFPNDLVENLQTNNGLSENMSSQPSDNVRSGYYNDNASMNDKSCHRSSTLSLSLSENERNLDNLAKTVDNTTSETAGSKPANKTLTSMFGDEFSSNMLMPAYMQFYPDFNSQFLTQQQIQSFRNQLQSVTAEYNNFLMQHYNYNRNKSLVQFQTTSYADFDSKEAVTVQANRMSNKNPSTDPYLFHGNATLSLAGDSSNLFNDSNVYLNIGHLPRVDNYYGYHANSINSDYACHHKNSQSNASDVAYNLQDLNNTRYNEIFDDNGSDSMNHASDSKKVDKADLNIDGKNTIDNGNKECKKLSKKSNS